MEVENYKRKINYDDNQDNYENDYVDNDKHNDDKISISNPFAIRIFSCKQSRRKPPHIFIHLKVSQQTLNAKESIRQQHQ